MATLKKHVGRFWPELITIGNSQKKIEKPSKELELLNFKAFLLENPEHFVGQKTQGEQINVNKFYRNNKVSPESKNTNEDGNQFLSFQRAMKILLIYGQCLGLLPVSGIFEKDITKMRNGWCTWRVLYGLVVGLSQGFVAIICLYKTVAVSLTIRGLAYVSFYFCTFSCTFMFLRVAVKWPSLMKELNDCGLQHCIDPKIKFKCHLACYIILFLVMFDYTLSHISRYVEIMDCSDSGMDLFENSVRLMFPWAYEMGVQYFLPAAILLEIFNTINTFNWSYPDLFIICISIYLSSILNSIIKKIESAYKNNYLPPSFWCSLREDYNRASRLVRSFDDSISGVIFISFANNIFFICLQLFYSLGNGLKSRQHYFRTLCPNYPSGPFGGYEASIYLIFSVAFLLTKFLAVSLITSGVHTSSMKAAPALYNIASPMYCEEIQRFLDQVHSDTVALSGFQFFYVTREIILSVVGTIVTYELVMLQFSSESSN